MQLGPRGGKRLTTLARLSAVGIELSLSIVIGLLGGGFLDKKLGTDPYLMIVGLILGAAAGFRSLVATARKANEDSRTSNPDQANDTDTRNRP